MQIKTTLYKQASKGAVQQWKVYVNDSKITVEYGQVDGKLQTKDTYAKGKNIGKSNETTDAEQAILEASSKWEKQTKKGYVECPTGTRIINLPMKIESYFKGKMKDKIIFPATIGRKLNGVNAESRIRSGEFVQLSRGGEEYPLPPKDVQIDLIKVMNNLNVSSLNYEIYLHGKPLQDITGAVKAPKNHTELWEALEYYIFDLPTYNQDWKKREQALNTIELGETSKVKVVRNDVVNSHEDIIKYQNKVIAEGYEGSVVRNYSGLYLYNTRTMDVQKVKYVQSDEFKVAAYTLDKNNQPVFTCCTETGTFKVKPKGTKEQREEIRLEASSWINNWMTVEYEMLSKEGIPLKPVGIALRKGYVDTDGKFVPTE